MAQALNANALSKGAQHRDAAAIPALNANALSKGAQHRDAAAIPALVSSLLLLLAAGCSRVGVDSGGGPTQELRSFTMTQTESSRPLWKLKAPRADISMGGDADLENPEILFFREGKHTSTARARRAVVEGATRDVRLEGDVVLVGHEEKATLKTARLYYSGETRRFRTDEEVFVEQPGAKLRGRGLEADASLSEITIFEQETRFQ